VQHTRLLSMFLMVALIWIAQYDWEGRVPNQRLTVPEMVIRQTSTATPPLASAQTPTPQRKKTGKLPTSSPSSPFPATATNTPPSSVRLNVKGNRQTMGLSCEARVAADWAAYFDVAIEEQEFQARLPLSDDPEKGFVGNANGYWGQIPPGDYGVHAAPVAALLREYGLPARDGKGWTWEELRAELAAGRPVIVWVVGHTWTSVTPVTYRLSDGSSTIVAPFEHTVILVGYNENPAAVTVLDGADVRHYPLDVFLESWSKLGYMVVALDANGEENAQEE